jgi:hypothetical protein
MAADSSRFLFFASPSRISSESVELSLLIDTAVPMPIAETKDGAKMERNDNRKSFNSISLGLSVFSMILWLH